MLSSTLGNLLGHTPQSTIQDEPFCKWRMPEYTKPERRVAVAHLDTPVEI